MNGHPSVGTLVNLDTNALQRGRNSRWHGLKDENFNDLLTGIAEQGQLVPIQVFYDKAGKPIVKFGNRRVSAIEILNQGRKPEDRILVKCEVVEKADALQVFLQNIGENVDRADMTPMDKAFAMNELKTTFKCNGETVAKAFRCTPASVSVLMNLLDCIPEVQGMVHLGFITVNEAVKMIREKWSKKDQKDHCAEVAKKLGKTVPQVLAGKKGRKTREKKADKSSLKTGKQVKEALDSVLMLPGLLPSAQKIITDISEWIDSKLSVTDLASLISGKTNEEVEELLEASSEDGEEEDDEEQEDDD